MNLQNPDFEPLCGEIDLAGYVISVVDGKGRWFFFCLFVLSLAFLTTACIKFAEKSSSFEHRFVSCILFG